MIETIILSLFAVALLVGLSAWFLYYMMKESEKNWESNIKHAKEQREALKQEIIAELSHE